MVSHRTHAEPVIKADLIADEIDQAEIAPVVELLARPEISWEPTAVFELRIAALTIASGAERSTWTSGESVALEGEGRRPLTGERAGSSNADAVRRSFATQAGAFEDPARSFASADVATWMVKNSRPARTDIVLEVAAGTALFGRALAPVVHAVIAVDLTLEMLEEGKRAADAQGRSNIVFQLGDVTALPLLDRSFDKVISRLALHHFDEPSRALREMTRVCRRGGHLVIIDMVVASPEEQQLFNELERRRDSAHTRALTRDELRASIVSAGCGIVHRSTWQNVLDGERWLQQTHTTPADCDIIRDAWRSELDGGTATGMRPRVRDGRIEFVHDWDLLVASVET